MRQRSEFRDIPGAGITRTRGVLVLKDPDLVVTLDRASSRTVRQFQTLWHLPSDQVATVYSRTTAIAAAPGDTSRTILLQIPYKQDSPAGAIQVKRGITSRIQGWHYPDIFHRNAAPTAMFARSGTSASILSFIAPVSANGTVMYQPTRPAPQLSWTSPSMVIWSESRSAPVVDWFASSGAEPPEGRLDRKARAGFPSGNGIEATRRGRCRIIAKSTGVMKTRGCVTCHENHWRNALGRWGTACWSPSWCLSCGERLLACPRPQRALRPHRPHAG